MITKKNVFDDIPSVLPDELVEILAKGEGSLKIERIVSRGHTSPPDYWYDQSTTEWVILIRGSAQLKFADPESQVSVNPGDWLEIPPHTKHRVESTSETEDTVWIAIHWE